MSDALFTEADIYEGDPTSPGMDQPTPADVVARLTRKDRELRVTRLVQQANDIVDEASSSTHLDGRTLAATCILFSGGNDSTTVAHMLKGRATHAVHANTTIGIEATRQFVRETCEAWGLPLIERKPPRKADHYRNLVIRYGFPGPAQHFSMYRNLKERALMQVRRELLSDHRSERLLFIGGIRRAESARRKDRDAIHREGSIIWASPIINWTKLDMNTYRLMNTDVPRNGASDTLHMSGECLCGAFAKPGELDEIGFWYPEVRAEIEALEAEVRAAGHPEPLCTWGHGQGKPSEEVGALCTSCDARFIPGQTDLLDAINAEGAA